MLCSCVQVAAGKAKSRQGIRWHPLFIRWCLSILISGPKTYDVIRDSEFFILPSRRTLRDYTNWTKTKIGYQMETLKMLMAEAEKLESYQRYDCILEKCTLLKHTMSCHV